MPPMRGILRSVITMEGTQCAAFSRPSTPSRAVSARYPQEETNSARPVRSFSSSSTISTFSWLIPMVVPASSRSCFLAASSAARLQPYAASFLRGKVWRPGPRAAYGQSNARIKIPTRSCQFETGIPPRRKLQPRLTEEAILENRSFSLRLQCVRITRFPAEVFQAVDHALSFGAACVPKRVQARAQIIGGWNVSLYLLDQEPRRRGPVRGSCGVTHLDSCARTKRLESEI